MIAVEQTTKFWDVLIVIFQDHIRSKYEVEVGESNLWFRFREHLRDQKKERRYFFLLEALASSALTASGAEDEDEDEKPDAPEPQFATEAEESVTDLHRRLEQTIRSVMDAPDVHTHLRQVFEQAVTGDRDRKREERYRKFAQQFRDVILESGDVVSAAENVEAHLTPLRSLRNPSKRFVDDYIEELDAALNRRSRKKLSDIDKRILKRKADGLTNAEIAAEIQREACEEYAQAIDGGSEPSRAARKRRKFSEATVSRCLKKVKSVWTRTVRSIEQ